MAELIKMPRLSDTMEEGTVATWFKKVGDKVEEGEILAEIETDKATMEFESFYEGTLLYIGINENETAKGIYKGYTLPMNVDRIYNAFV